MKGIHLCQTYCRALIVGHCYKLVIQAQALRNLYFVYSLPEDGARKLGVVAAAGKSHLILLLLYHKPCSFSRAALRWCRWLTVRRGDAVGLLEVDWFSLFLLHNPLHSVRGRTCSWLAGWDQETRALFAVLLLILSKVEQDPEPVSVPVFAEGTDSGARDAKPACDGKQRTLLSLTNCNSMPGFILFSSWWHILDQFGFWESIPQTQ